MQTTCKVAKNVCKSTLFVHKKAIYVLYVGMYVILKKRKIENLAEGKMKEEYKVKNLSLKAVKKITRA